MMALSAISAVNSEITNGGIVSDLVNLFADFNTFAYWEKSLSVSKYCYAGSHLLNFKILKRKDPANLRVTSHRRT